MISMKAAGAVIPTIASAASATDRNRRLNKKGQHICWPFLLQRRASKPGDDEPGERRRDDCYNQSQQDTAALCIVSGGCFCDFLLARDHRRDEVVTLDEAVVKN